MATPATNGAASTPSDLPEEVSKPPEGVVLPPKDIRSEFNLHAAHVLDRYTKATCY